MSALYFSQSFPTLHLGRFGSKSANALANYGVVKIPVEPIRASRGA